MVTITKGRPRLLARAMVGVEAQTAAGRLEHLVLVDECRATAEALSAISHPSWRHWLGCPRDPGTVSGPGRSSRLRNFGAGIARGEWVAFLDDDNEWETDHIEALLAAADKEGTRAANSFRQLLNRDGSPFLDERSPWALTEETAVAEYERLEALGVVSRGSNVRRDRLMPEAIVVDTGEWLLARDLLLEVPFRDDFDDEDECGLVGEDDKLAADLLARRVEVACTERATLRYYLGGYSNNSDARRKATFAWR